MKIIGEGDMGSDEDVILQSDTVPDAHTILQGDVVSELCAGLHEGVISHIAVVADDGSLEDVSKGPDTRPNSDLVRLDKSCRMDEWVRHAASGSVEQVVQEVKGEQPGSVEAVA